MDKLRTVMILEHLRKAKSCTLGDLQRKFGVSRATIYRDVAELSRRDAVRVMRGGLVWSDTCEPRMPMSAYNERVVANRAEKLRLAGNALNVIAEGDIVFLDSSTTVFELAMLLKTSGLAHLTLITNSLAIMQSFRKFPREWNLIGLGGNFDGELNSIIGAPALRQIESLNVTKAFFSAFGIDSRNVTTNNENQAELLRSVISFAEKNYLLVDKSKFRRAGIYRISSRSAFTRIFS